MATTTAMIEAVAVKLQWRRTPEFIAFALTQTAGLPWLIELAVFVDILGAVMIAGLLVFNIKKSFAHIDVSRLTDTNH
jgi:hydrogenase-4 membrane subunit HyfE